MNTEIVHVYSGDSVATHPNNTAFDFTIDLLDEIKGEYKIALLDFKANVSELLYIFCDVIEPTYCRDRTLPVIRVVQNGGEFQNLHFYKASRRVIQRINVYIRNKDLKIPTNDIGPVLATLLFVPI